MSTFLCDPVCRRTCWSRRVADVLAAVRAEEEWQGPRLLGAGGIDPHGPRLAAEGGRVSGRREATGADRLGGAGPPDGQEGSAASVAVRSAGLPRTGRGPGAGADQGREPGTATRLRGRLAGAGALATFATRRVTRRAAAGRRRARALAGGGGDPDGRAV